MIRIGYDHLTVDLCRFVMHRVVHGNVLMLLQLLQSYDSKQFSYILTENFLQYFTIFELYIKIQRLTYCFTYTLAVWYFNLLNYSNIHTHTQSFEFLIYLSLYIKKKKIYLYIHQWWDYARKLSKKNNNIKEGHTRIWSLITGKASPSPRSFLLRNARCNDLESLGSGRSYVFKYFYFRRREPRLINYAV